MATVGWNIATNNYATTAASTYTISLGDWNGSGYVAVAPQQPKPRTNLDWLDERIDEMRVKL